MLLGATHYLTLDVAPIPLLWVLPLSVYLGTFILAFARPSPVRVPALSRWMAVLAVALSLALLARVRDPVWVVVLLHVGMLAVAGLLCHGRLAAARPEARRLTEFYMFVAIGGAFAALAGPRLFDDLIEYPIAIVLACMLRVGRTPDEHIAPDDHHTLRRSAMSRALDVALPAALALFMLAVWLGGEELAEGPFVLFSAIVPAVACFFLSPRPLRFALGVAVLLSFAYSTQADRGEFLHAECTFFGVHRVTRDPADRYTVLRHGSTIHGVQSTDPARATEPLGYYHVGGPGGQVLRSLAERSPESRIAFVGLGAGALAVLTAPRQRLTLYEIDRAVVDIAEDTRWFTYLANSPAPYHVVVADGRIALARTEERYDLIVLDAFSSAAVPIHLLTCAAVALYLEWAGSRRRAPLPRLQPAPGAGAGAREDRRRSRPGRPRADRLRGRSTRREFASARTGCCWRRGPTISPASPTPAGASCAPPRMPCSGRTTSPTSSPCSAGPDATPRRAAGIAGRIRSPRLRLPARGGRAGIR